MNLSRSAPCKINLLLNVLGRRPDGFHEIETLLQPVDLHDTLEFRSTASGLSLTCSDPRLPVDHTNLVHRAANRFLEAARLTDGVQIHLEKRIPMEAGLGGGSANAAVTLLGLNELFGAPLDFDTLVELGARLGSDVVFFLRPAPAIATGRGEKVEWLEPFPALGGHWLALVHPGFGVSTPWAYRALAGSPAALVGRPGRANELREHLQSGDLTGAWPLFYNALEEPVLRKYPWLALAQDALRDHGARVVRMSGSGSATFAIFARKDGAETAIERFRRAFGEETWTAVIGL